MGMLQAERTETMTKLPKIFGEAAVAPLAKVTQEASMPLGEIKLELGIIKEVSQFS